MWLEYAQICNHFHLYDKTAYYLKHLEDTADWISKDHKVAVGMNRECYYQAKAKMFENTNRLDSAIVFISGVWHRLTLIFCMTAVGRFAASI